MDGRNRMSAGNPFASTSEGEGPNLETMGEVLITGGAGFLGRYLANGLAASGNSVTVRWDDLNAGAAPTGGSWSDSISVKNLTTNAFLPVGGYYTMNVEEAAGLALAMTPRLAVPMHYGFVVGSATDGDRFRDAASPVAVDLMAPTNPFEC